MKHILFTTLCILGATPTSAYEWTSGATAPRITIHAGFRLNAEPRRIELELKNRTLNSSITIQKNVIQKAIQEKNARVSQVTLAPGEKNSNTLLTITDIWPSNQEPSSFSEISSMLRSYRKYQDGKNLYESLINRYDIPSSYTIPELPFVSQAPLGTKENWEIHEESCEEAALLLNHFITNHIKFTPESMNTEIIRMNDYEKQHGIAEDKYSTRYGKFFLKDLTDPQEMYDLLTQRYLGYADHEVLMLNKPTQADIDRLIASDHVLTIPMKYTKTLRNKYIRTEKTFHIMNLVGYTPDTFLTLDPGTKNGHYLIYPKQTLYESMQQNGNYLIVLKNK